MISTLSKGSCSIVLGSEDNIFAATEEDFKEVQTSYDNIQTLARSLEGNALRLPKRQSHKHDKDSPSNDTVSEQGNKSSDGTHV